MSRPAISVVIVVHDMARQAMNTVRSLLPPYQEGVSTDDYEIVVVENRSERSMSRRRLEALGGPVRYIRRHEAGTSPAAALNAGFAAATGETVGIMIDGARMVSPGVLRHVAMARAITPDSVVSVPGYELGRTLQSQDPEHDEERERRMLKRIGWPSDGYALFGISVLSPANRNGVLRPFMECNCIFAPAWMIAEVGGADESFAGAGGGALNLWLYNLLVTHPRARPFVLPGEGSFHQVHGGVTTRSREDLAEVKAAFKAELDSRLGRKYVSPDVRPTLLGTLPPEMHAPLEFSAGRFAGRARNLLRERAEARRRAAGAAGETGAPDETGEQDEMGARDGAATRNGAT